MLASEFSRTRLQIESWPSSASQNSRFLSLHSYLLSSSSTARRSPAFQLVPLRRTVSVLSFVAFHSPFMSLSFLLKCFLICSPFLVPSASLLSLIASNPSLLHSFLHALCLLPSLCSRKLSFEPPLPHRPAQTQPRCEFSCTPLLKWHLWFNLCNGLRLNSPLIAAQPLERKGLHQTLERARSHQMEPKTGARSRRHTGIVAMSRVRGDEQRKTHQSPFIEDPFHLMIHSSLLLYPSNSPDQKPIRRLVGPLH